MMNRDELIKALQGTSTHAVFSHHEVWGNYVPGENAEVKDHVWFFYDSDKDEYGWLQAHQNKDGSWDRILYYYGKSTFKSVLSHWYGMVKNNIHKGLEEVRDDLFAQVSNSWMQKMNGNNVRTILSEAMELGLDWEGNTDELTTLFMAKYVAAAACGWEAPDE